MTLKTLMDVRSPADKKIGFRNSETEPSRDASARLFLGRSLSRCSLGRSSLSGSLALFASASLALGAFSALLGFFALLAILAACLLLGSGVLFVAVTAATYHCNGSDQNNE